MEIKDIVVVVTAILTYLVLALSTGCSTTQSSPGSVVKQEVLVSVPCKVNTSEKPAMPLTGTGKVEEDLFSKVKKALAEIDLRISYETKLEAAIKGCQE